MKVQVLVLRLMCTNWVPPWNMVHLSQLDNAKRHESFENLLSSGGGGQGTTKTKHVDLARHWSSPFPQSLQVSMVTNQNCDVRTITQKRQLVWHTTLHSPGVFLLNTKTEQAAWGSLLIWWEAVPPFHLRSLCAKDGRTPQFYTWKMYCSSHSLNVPLPPTFSFSVWLS